MKVERKKTDRVNSIIAVLLSGSMVLALCLTCPKKAEAAGGAEEKLQNPRVEMNTCDTVYFGSYWQEDTNGDGVADQRDEKTPIRWRVLSKNGNDIYVIADKVLDCKPYNCNKEESVTWTTSTLREWLNDEFLTSAFTAEEQMVITEQILLDENNETYSTSNGVNVKDKVFLPSIVDMKNTAYGFRGEMYFGDQARIGKATAYAKAQGIRANGEMGCRWWLRSSGNGSDDAESVDDSGEVGVLGYGVYNSGSGVRPALHLDITSSLVVKGEMIETSLKSASWDLVELGRYEGKPIKWRVLKTESDDVCLLSDKLLGLFTDYNVEIESITWKDSTLRYWLNEKFYEKVFNEAEKKGIKQYLYENKDNQWYGTEGGEDTKDYITLLSLEDIINKEYGFPTDYNCDHEARNAYGQYGEESLQGDWFLRSSGSETDDVAYVDIYGSVNVMGTPVTNPYYVRGVVHLNPAVTSLKKVGTVISDEGGTKWDNLPEHIEHSPEVDVAIEAFCETEGKTEGRHCSVCGEVLKEQEIVPAKGHQWDDGAVIKKATSTKNGKKIFTCKVCGKTRIEEIKVTGENKQNSPTKVNIKNKKTYSISKKVTVKDADGIKSIKLNGKNIRIKKRKSYSFKLSNYKKSLKRKGRWNKLVITDSKGKKTTIKFKTK